MRRKKYSKMNNILIIDRRWQGHFGIGRYSREIIERLEGISNGYLDGSIPTSKNEILKSLIQPKRNFKLYSPGYMSSFSYKNEILTLHDLILLKKSYGSTNVRLYFNRYLKPRILDGAIKILTVSKTSALEISDWANVPLSSIEIISNGLSKTILNYSQLGTVARKKRSLMYVGSMKEHKNYDLFVEAVNGLTGKWEVNVVGADLQMNGYNSHHDVKKHVNISEKQLVKLYLSSDMLINTSSYEGFGMPILEGAYLGCKIIHFGVLPTVREMLGRNSFHTNGRISAKHLAMVINSTCEIEYSMNKEFARNLELKYSWDKSATKIRRILTANGV